MGVCSKISYVKLYQATPYFNGFGKDKKWLKLEQSFSQSKIKWRLLVDLTHKSTRIRSC